MSTSPIYLNKEDREIVKNFAKNGEHNAHLIRRANILLDLDRADKEEHMKITHIASKYDVSRQTMYNIIRDYHNSKDINDFLSRKKRETPPVPPKADGEIEAHIIAMACSKPPEGYARWTLKLLAQKAVELNFIDSISPMTVQRLLKKQNISLI